MKRRCGGLTCAIVWIWAAVFGTLAGCTGPQARTTTPGVPAPVLTADSSEAGPADLPVEITGAAPSSANSAAAGAGSLVETWVVHTRACEQKMGTDPWASVTVGRFDGLDVPLHGTPPEVLLDRMAGRQCVFLLHGYGYTYRAAVEEAVTVRGLLESAGGLPPETILIIFDWPSERALRGFYADLNEKAKRTRIAAFHLARILQEAPAGSRFCFLSQSDGGRIALNTMHLLSGAELPANFGAPPGQLTAGRPDLRLRCVLVDAAVGHHWMNPGERIDQAIPSCEALFNIYNTGDAALMVFILGRYTGFRPAIGQVGLTKHDLAALGPLADRVEQIDLHARVGFSHTSIPQALGFSDVAQQIAEYTSFRELSSTTR